MTWWYLIISSAEHFLPWGWLGFMALLTPITVPAYIVWRIKWGPDTSNPNDPVRPNY